MKSKLLLFVMIIAFMLSVLVLPAMAANNLIEITRPEGNEIVTKDIFSIWGKCFYDETTITLEYKDRETDEYKPLTTTDGVSSFKVGSSKTFGKDIKLKYDGDNIIKIIADTDTEHQVVGPFTITLGKKKDKSWWEDPFNWFGIKDNKVEKDNKAEK